MQVKAPCSVPATQYWHYTTNVSLTLTSGVLQANSASCDTCSGGGLRLGAGGSLVLGNVSVVGNQAMQFGGGCQLGYLGSFHSTCSVVMGPGTVFLGNAAAHGGDQFYSVCTADVAFDGAAFHLENRTSQVRVGYRLCKGL